MPGSTRYRGKYSEAELLRQNLEYARLVLADSIDRGEAPITSPQLHSPGKVGLKVSLQLHHRSDVIALYADLGISSDMRLAADNAGLINTELETRRILDTAGGRDPREQLARPAPPTGPGRVIPFRQKKESPNSLVDA